MLPEMPFTVVLQGGGCGSGILWMLSLSACRLWFCFCGSCYDLIFAIACSCCLRFLWFPFFGALQLFCVRVLRWVVCCGCCGFCDSHPAAVFEDVAVVVVAVVVEVWLVVVFFIVVEAFACGLTMFFFIFVAVLVTSSRVVHLLLLLLSMPNPQLYWYCRGGCQCYDGVLMSLLAVATTFAVLSLPSLL